MDKESVAGKYYMDIEAFMSQPLRVAYILSEKKGIIQVEKQGSPWALVVPTSEGPGQPKNTQPVKIISVNKLQDLEREVRLGQQALLVYLGKAQGIAISMLPSAVIEDNRAAEQARIKEYIKNNTRRVRVVDSLELDQVARRWKYIRDVIDGDGDLLITRGSEPVAYLCPTPQAHLMLGARFGCVEVESLQGSKHETLVDELQRYEYVLLTKDKPGEGSSVWDLGAATAAIPPEALAQLEA